MSHLNHVIAYREALTNMGVSCPQLQSDACQEAYVRAVLMNHTKFNDGFGFTEEEENLLWQQLEKWNRVSPTKGKFILETAKYRLLSVRKQLMEDGTLLGNAQFDIYADVQRAVETEVHTAKADLTDCAQFKDLVQYLYTELRGEHE